MKRRKNKKNKARQLFSEFKSDKVTSFPLSSLCKHNRAHCLCGHFTLNPVGQDEIKVTMKDYNRLTDHSQPSKTQM